MSTRDAKPFNATSGLGCDSSVEGMRIHGHVGPYSIFSTGLVLPWDEVNRLGWPDPDDQGHDAMIDRIGDVLLAEIGRQSSTEAEAAMAEVMMHGGEGVAYLTPSEVVVFLKSAAAHQSMADQVRQRLDDLIRLLEADF